MRNRSEVSEEDNSPPHFVAFEGVARIASGGLAQVALAAKQAQLRNPAASVIVFDLEIGKVADLDLRGTEQEIVTRYTPQVPSTLGRGRPKLGVVAREVTLLPRHWDWLARQPGGASITLRKLVEAARKADGGATKSRERVEAAYRFMSVMAGDLPAFEDGARALFAGDRNRLATVMSQWPSDICNEVLRFFDGAAWKG
ncbi:conserved hypothetical protein [Methylocella tundrae]|uniref:DUF2239 domain-containing protein n=1 Tax=Methylocella tundrae TaxID=227605 RepID=A0A8B6M5E5_METTU|nr:DUF2239 family protein [Methylocella tundrae]VTZ49312.1 conserved hypothetical protein [Methylocella tundrae]